MNTSNILKEGAGGAEVGNGSCVGEADSPSGAGRRGNDRIGSTMMIKGGGSAAESSEHNNNSIQGGLKISSTSSSKKKRGEQ